MAIIKCTCEHEYQDKTYGKQLRVHNWAVAKNNKDGGWVCTICERVKDKKEG